MAVRTGEAKVLSGVKLHGSSTQARADLPAAAVWREMVMAGALGMANNAVAAGAVALVGTAAVAAAETRDVTGRWELADRRDGTALDHQTAWRSTAGAAGGAEDVAAVAAAGGEASARRRCYETAPSASPDAYSHSQLPYSLHSSPAGAVLAAAGNGRPGAFVRDDGADGPGERGCPLRTLHRDIASLGSRLGAGSRTSDGMRLGGVAAGH